MQVAHKHEDEGKHKAKEKKKHKRSQTKGKNMYKNKHEHVTAMKNDTFVEWFESGYDFQRQRCSMPGKCGAIIVF